MDTLALIIGIIIVIALIGIGPVLTILSLNALFNTGIAISFGNWLAVVWLGLLGAGIVQSGTKGT